MNISRLLHSKYSAYFISLILGLGLATLFKKASNKKNCMVFKAPSLEDIKDKQYKFDQYIVIISPLIILAYMSFSLDVWAERVHFIQYGLLGLLVSRAYKISSFIMFLASCLFLMTVGLVDELIQWYLPNRYGDIRDVMMNSLGGLSGLWLGQFLYWEENYLKDIFIKK